MRLRLLVCALATCASLYPLSAFADNGTPFDRVRIGISDHGVAPQESNTIDLSGEVITNKLYVGDPNSSATPALHAGVDLNTGGKTSVVYGGATFTGPLADKIYWEGDAGLAIHSGSQGQPGYANLGNCAFALRGQALIGFQVTDKVDLSTGLEHLNAMGICGGDHTGLTNLVAKVGYKF